MKDGPSPCACPLGRAQGDAVTRALALGNERGGMGGGVRAATGCGRPGGRGRRNVRAAEHLSLRPERDDQNEGIRVLGACAPCLRPAWCAGPIDRFGHARTPSDGHAATGRTWVVRDLSLSVSPRVSHPAGAVPCSLKVPAGSLVPVGLSSSPSLLERGNPLHCLGALSFPAASVSIDRRHASLPSLCHLPTGGGRSVVSLCPSARCSGCRNRRRAVDPGRVVSCLRALSCGRDGRCGVSR